MESVLTMKAICVVLVRGKNMVAGCVIAWCCDAAVMVTVGPGSNTVASMEVVVWCVNGSTMVC